MQHQQDWPWKFEEESAISKVFRVTSLQMTSQIKGKEVYLRLGISGADTTMEGEGDTDSVFLFDQGM